MVLTDVFFQWWMFAKSGEALTQRLRRQSFLALMRQVTLSGHSSHEIYPTGRKIPCRKCQYLIVMNSSLTDTTNRSTAVLFVEFWGVVGFKELLNVTRPTVTSSVFPTYFTKLKN